MTEITAQMVKALREQSGAGMMECKKALTQANGDMQEAQKLLAQAGLNKAAKVETRAAAQGRLVGASDAQGGALLEINCETDFVARDESFVSLTQKAVECLVSHKITELDALLATTIDGMTIDEHRKALMARLGENIQIRRMAYYPLAPQQSLGIYIHQNRIAVLIILAGGSATLAKDLSMHAAAMNAQYIDSKSISATLRQQEKEKILSEDKDIADIEQALNTHLREVTLLEQPYIKDANLLVAQLLENEQAQVVTMKRFDLGEGIEIHKKSFEEEVMEVRGQAL